MNKKILFVLVIVFIVTLLVIFKLFITNSELARLEKYNLLSNESIRTEFKYKDKDYVITSYQESTSTYAYNNLLLKYKNKYYLLERIDKCDMSEYVKDNDIYIHCIGKTGSILKYTVDKFKVKSEVLKFDYKNTPNISQIHMTIEKIDDYNIYLKSAVKKDDSIKEGESIKCSLQSMVCEYN